MIDGMLIINKLKKGKGNNKKVLVKPGKRNLDQKLVDFDRA